MLCLCTARLEERTGQAVHIQSFLNLLRQKCRRVKRSIPQKKKKEIYPVRGTFSKVGIGDEAIWREN